uniref:Uncharacterized protein n=1 Tax=Rhizophora mucronata TaxID=61149 RepID=A0A2P2ND19_RHIMU
MFFSGVFLLNMFHSNLPFDIICLYCCHCFLLPLGFAYDGIVFLDA